MAERARPSDDRTTQKTFETGSGDALVLEKVDEKQRSRL